jgi:hypothetical protein
MKVLYEILVPEYFNDGKKVPLLHHIKWDKFVKNITGGLTILKPAKGIWYDKSESMIPVRMMCDEPEIYFHGIEPTGDFDKRQIKKIVAFTLDHYQQDAIMHYKISDDVHITRI